MSSVLGSGIFEAGEYDRKLAAVYADMDQAYAEAAEYHGFRCQGCKDNCCETEFHHHTMVEYLYIYRGFEALPAQMKPGVLARAEAALVRRQSKPTGGHLRIMCPLNTDGRCILYSHRPMICRLHGIPSMFRHPMGGISYSPGCGDFDRLGNPDAETRLDRTPFYARMAQLEKALRSDSGIENRIRMTIADMIVTFVPLQSPSLPAERLTTREIP
ncbi:MAG: hypothetical protein ACOWWM_08040 [Desulfobacterales bacterium]